MTGPGQPGQPPPGPAGPPMCAPESLPVPNPLIPDPVIIDCAACGTPFVCDATSRAAREQTCGPCAIPSRFDPPRPPGSTGHPG